MELKELLPKELMIMDLQSEDKEDIINEMIDRLADREILNDIMKFRREVIKQEADTSTAIGEGIAIPHAKTHAVNKSCVLFARSRKGVDFESLDEEPTFLFFMIAQKTEDDQAVEAFTELSQLLLHEGFIDVLRMCETPDEVYEAIEKEQTGMREEEQMKPLVVCVTGCSIGIIQTHMAQEALLRVRLKKDILIRVETQATDGTHHALTAAEIEDAIGVIIACDKKIDMSRFDKKRVLKASVSDAIRRPEELINAVLSEKVPVFRFTEKVEESYPVVYRHLMNGIVHAVPFVACGSVVYILSKIFHYLHKDTRVYSFLHVLGNNTFGLVFPVLSGYIAVNIGGSSAFMMGMVSGLMATRRLSMIAGHIPISMKREKIDVLATSCHKGLGALQGIGLLLFPQTMDISPFRYGGTGIQSEKSEMPSSYPQRLEAGTPNVAGIFSLNESLKEIEQIGLSHIAKTEQELAHYLYQKISSLPIKILSTESPILSFTVNVSDLSAIADLLDSVYGIACRVGLHCAPTAHRTIGTYPYGTIRFSINYTNTTEEIDRVVSALQEILRFTM